MAEVHFLRMSNLEVPVVPGTGAEAATEEQQRRLEEVAAKLRRGEQLEQDEVDLLTGEATAPARDNANCWGC